MDIKLTIGGIHTLANVIIVDSTHANLVSLGASSRGVAMTIVAHAKVVSYRDQHLEDDFIHLVAEIFGYLH